MQKTILITVALTTLMLTSISNIAKAGWFDNSSQKYFNSFTKCYEEVTKDRDVSCTVELFKEENRLKINKEEIDVGDYTEKDLQKMGTVLALANNCVGPDNMLDPEMWTNPFAQGMCKKAGFPYNKKFDDPEYAKKKLWGTE